MASQQSGGAVDVDDEAILAEIRTIMKDGKDLNDIFETITKDFYHLLGKIDKDNQGLRALYEKHLMDFTRERLDYAALCDRLDRPIQIFLDNLSRYTPAIKKKFLDFMRNYYDFQMKRFFYFLTDLRMNHLTKLGVGGRLSRLLQPHQYTTAAIAVRRGSFASMNDQQRTFIRQLKKRITNAQQIQKMESSKPFQSFLVQQAKKHQST